MKPASMCKYFIIAGILLSSIHAGADKIYKTYEDYVNGKPMLEGAIEANKAAINVYYFIVKVTKDDGQVEKINIKDIWGFERIDANDITGDSVLMYRTIHDKLYRCLCRGKYYCWVSDKYDIITYPRHDEIYSLMPVYTGTYNTATNSNGSMSNRDMANYDANLMTCFYSTGIGSDCTKLESGRDFLALITEDEKKAVLAKMKETHIAATCPYVVMQVYNQLFPIAVIKSIQQH